MGSGTGSPAPLPTCSRNRAAHQGSGRRASQHLRENRHKFAYGDRVFHLAALFAQLERDMIRQRTRAAAAAKARVFSSGNRRRSPARRRSRRSKSGVESGCHSGKSGNALITEDKLKLSVTTIDKYATGKSKSEERLRSEHRNARKHWTCFVAGGASMGLYRAGLMSSALILRSAHVTVHVPPSRRLDVPLDGSDLFGVALVSPFFRSWTPERQLRRLAGFDRSYPAASLETGAQWVIENVERAPLRNPVMLCGTMFSGLRCCAIGLFEANFLIPQPLHGKHPLVHILTSVSRTLVKPTT